MAIVLPILSFFILSWFLRKARFCSRRETYLASAIACSGWVWLTTETLSLFRILNPIAIMLAWIVFLFGVIILFLKEKRVPQETSHSRLLFAPLDVVIIIIILLIFLGIFRGLIRCKSLFIKLLEWKLLLEIWIELLVFLPLTCAMGFQSHNLTCKILKVVKGYPDS